MRTTHEQIDALGTLARGYREERRRLLPRASKLLRDSWRRLGVPVPRRRPWRPLPPVPGRRLGRSRAKLLRRHAGKLRRNRSQWKGLAKTSWPALGLRWAIFYYHFRARWATPLALAVLGVLLLWLLSRSPEIWKALELGGGSPP